MFYSGWSEKAVLRRWHLSRVLKEVMEGATQISEECSGHGNSWCKGPGVKHSCQLRNKRAVGVVRAGQESGKAEVREAD